MAAEMERELRIPDQDLFYYLLFDELEPLIRAPQPQIVAQALRRRNMFKRTFEQAWKFDEVALSHLWDRPKPRPGRSSPEEHQSSSLQSLF